MKIIPAAYEILRDIPDLPKQIEARGRICYKSEDKITDTSAKKFCQTYKNHGTVFEMAIIHVQMDGLLKSEVAILNSSKFLVYNHDLATNNSHYVTGSVRAWREWLMSYTGVTGLVNRVHELLMLFHPVLFTDIELPWCPADSYNELYLTEPRQIPVEFRERHVHQAVRIITNRAVTHEIVRHRPCSYLQESQRYCRYDKDQFGNEVTFIDPRIAFPFFQDEANYEVWEVAMAVAETVYLGALEEGASPQAARTVLPNSCKTEIIVYASLTEWRHIFYQRTSPAAEPSMREIMIPLHEEFQKLYPGVFDELSPSVAGQ